MLAAKKILFAVDPTNSSVLLHCYATTFPASGFRFVCFHCFDFTTNLIMYVEEWRVRHSRRHDHHTTLRPSGEKLTSKSFCLKCLKIVQKATEQQTVAKINYDVKPVRGINLLY